MTDYLDQLIARSVGTVDAVRPRPPSIFEVETPSPGPMGVENLAPQEADVAPAAPPANAPHRHSASPPAAVRGVLETPESLRRASNRPWPVPEGEPAALERQGSVAAPTRPTPPAWEEPTGDAPFARPIVSPFRGPAADPVHREADVSGLALRASAPSLPRTQVGSPPVGPRELSGTPTEDARQLGGLLHKLIAAPQAAEAAPDRKPTSRRPASAVPGRPELQPRPFAKPQTNPSVPADVRRAEQRRAPATAAPRHDLRAAASPLMPLAEPLPRPDPVGEPPREPVIHVTIGRVEVHSVPEQRPALPPRPRAPLMSLDDYLERRSERGRGS